MTIKDIDMYLSKHKFGTYDLVAVATLTAGITTGGILPAIIAIPAIYLAWRD